MRRHVVLFARAPALGAGKRRLARDIGAVAALRFERLMLHLLLRRLGRDRRWDLRLCVTPDRAVSRARRWRRRVPVSGQGRGDLGQRMQRALAACPPGPALLIGTDLPHLIPDHLNAAFRLLDRHDIVFGPANDGGFWLVGARHWVKTRRLFGAIRWSSPDALADAAGGLPPGLSVGFAQKLDDVDDAASYRRLVPRRGF